MLNKPHITPSVPDRTIQDLINQCMRKIITENSMKKSTVLDIIYQECFPFIPELFTSSGDFLLKIFPIMDYTLQINSKLKCFELKQLIQVDGVYIFTGENENSAHEAWAFVSTETKQNNDFIRSLQNRLASVYPADCTCYLYCLEDGEAKTYYFFKEFPNK
ncbi:hypothetical protein [Evansella clarkii]|jgi:hypothetical protein|uniref:hypothetical protein n=1 Tax=Evansella clarkii TaxID=79879 RepID=UPI0009976E49|nr:hypothetical protein [Evansella clarkii]